MVALISMGMNDIRNLIHAREGWGAHFTGAGRVGFLAAGEAEAQPAGALGLAVHLTLHPDGAPAVRHAWTPAHHRIVLAMPPAQSHFLVIRHKANYLYSRLTWYISSLLYAPSLCRVADRGAATAAEGNSGLQFRGRFRGIAPFSDLDYR